MHSLLLILINYIIVSVTHSVRSSIHVKNEGRTINMFPDRHDERQKQRITAEETRRLQCTDAPTQSPTISPIAKIQT